MASAILKAEMALGTRLSEIRLRLVRKVVLANRSTGKCLHSQKFSTGYKLTRFFCWLHRCVPPTVLKTKVTPDPSRIKVFKPAWSENVRDYSNGKTVLNQITSRLTGWTTVIFKSPMAYAYASYNALLFCDCSKCRILKIWDVYKRQFWLELCTCDLRLQTFNLQLAFDFWLRKESDDFRLVFVQFSYLVQVRLTPSWNREVRSRKLV